MRYIPDDVLISGPETPDLFLVMVDEFRILILHTLFEYRANPFDTEQGEGFDYKLCPVNHLSFIAARHFTGDIDDKRVTEQPPM